MSGLILRGYFIRKDDLFYATIPSIGISKINARIDGALEDIVVALEEHNIKASLTLIEGNGFTIECISGGLKKLLIEKMCL